jgi:ComF family protein
LNGIWIAGDYDNRLLADLIKNLKYRLIREVAPVLGQFAGLFLFHLLKRNGSAAGGLKAGLGSKRFTAIKKTPGALLDFKNNLLIPVPLHKNRERVRGFNQAEAIARSIAVHAGLACRTGRLLRLKPTPPQAKLGEKARLSNVINCFAWRGDDMRGENVLLVDDVVTTGATLDECARVLKTHGANEVWGLVIAKG